MVISLFNIFSVTLTVLSIVYTSFCSYTWTLSLGLAWFNSYEVNKLWWAQGNHLGWWGKYVGVYLQFKAFWKYYLKPILLADGMCIPTFTICSMHILILRTVLGAHYSINICWSNEINDFISFAFAAFFMFYWFVP